MPSLTEIDWPINPSSGQIYISPRGDVWIYRNCVWVATCCPPEACNIRIDGIKIGLVFYENPLYIEVGAVTVISLSYMGENIWEFSSQGLRFIIRSDYGIWGLYYLVENEEELLLGTLISDEPIGNWQQAGNSDTLQEIITECGNDSSICLTSSYYGGVTDSNTMFPIRSYVLESRNLNGDIQGYSGIENQKYIVIDGSYLQYPIWKLLGSGLHAMLETPSPPNLPVGTWTIVEADADVTLITTKGQCQCDPQQEGLSANMIFLVDQGENPPLEILLNFNLDYINNTYINSELFGVNNIINSPFINNWVFNIGDTTVATISGATPIGIWTIVESTPGIQVTNFEISCGQIPQNEGCLSYIRYLKMTYVNLTRGSIVDSDIIIYTNFSGMSVAFDGIDTWEIIDFNAGLIGTSPGDGSENLFNLNWTPVIPFSDISINQGYCNV